ncbi:MMPL family transporter [Jatrophihabitans fulvus]
MTTVLYRLGRGCAAHPWRTLAAWMVVLAALFGAAAAFGDETRDDWTVSDAPAQRGIDLLRDHLPAAANAGARVVVHDADGRVPAAALDRLADRLADVPHVAVVAPPRLSADGSTALVAVSYDVKVTDPAVYQRTGPLERAVAPTRADGLTVELGGDLPETAAAPIEGQGELIGVVVALIVLVLALGSVVAAGLPIGIAFIGLGAASAGITLLAATMDVSTSAPLVATMVGLGVGIDYALLLVTRQVEYLRVGHDLPEAAGRAAATAGRAVVLAGSTVLVSLFGLRLAGLPTYSAFGLTTGLAVVGVMAAALTLVPAFSRLAGRRLLPRAVRRGRATTVRAPLAERWATRVARRPVVWALAATTVLVALAAPVLALTTWPQDASSQSSELTTRRAYDLVADEFGPGANGPYLLVVDRAQAGPDATVRTLDALRSDGRIARIAPVVTSPDGALDVVSAEARFGPTDGRTADLVADLRDAVPSGVELTGTTPLFADISDLLADRLPVVIGFVVGVSVLLLGMMFRSVVVPLKAAAMNLLSVGAAYGVLVVVFQWGFGSSLLGLDHASPVSSWMPILLFTILFGLSMDYEVFLLSRVREAWLATGDPRRSVTAGVGSTGRVISAAAAIMVAVFVGFAFETDVIVKQLGLGLAVAVFLDATVVRLVLVPATLTLLGRRNWWMPAWLDAVLPRIRSEAAGTGASDAPDATDTPRDLATTAR